MRLRRAIVILLLFLLPLQATLAAADSCCLVAKVLQTGEQAVSAQDLPDSDGGCCTQCDFCHHFHAPFVGAPASAPQYTESIAPVQPPEPPIHSFIPDIPPRPDRLR